MMLGDRVVKKYKLVPPDGGWGYIICLAVTIIYSSSTMFMLCFGQIFNELLKRLDMNSTSISLLSGIGLLNFSLGGFVTRALLKLMSKRKLACLGSLLFNLGVFATVFINTKFLFFFFQGIIQSFGAGIMFNISATVLNEYFFEKRLFCISIVQSVTALATMFAPQIVDWASDMYGFTGTLLVVSAIALQTFVAVLMLQPVEWHMKKTEVIHPEENNQLLLIEKGAVLKTTNSKDPEGDVLGEDVTDDKKHNLKIIIKEVFDISELRSFLLSCAFLGSTIAVFSDFTFSLMLPQALYSMRWKNKTVSLAITCSGFGDLLTRISFIFFNKWLSKLGIQEVYIISLIIACATRLCMLCSENQTSILVFITLIGIARCSIMILPPLIIADVVPADKFTSAMGIYMLATGVFSLLCGFAIGAVRDLTESYATAFYILTSLFAIVAMFWIIELCYKRNKHRRNKQNIQKAKIKESRK